MTALPFSVKVGDRPVAERVGASLAPVRWTVRVAVPVAGLALASVAVTVKTSVGVAPAVNPLIAPASGT